MNEHRGFWRDCGLPVAVNMGVFCVLNYLWNQESLGLYNIISLPLPVYMLGGSMLGLFFLWDAHRRGVVGVRQLGLDQQAWRPWKRLLGATLIIVFPLFMMPTLPNVLGTPTWGDFLFWFFYLLPASFAELVLFLLVGFCLPEAWLRRRGIGPIWAGFIAAIFSGVTFGLYHYTHDERWHAYALNLIPVMWMNLLYFATTRNFHLTLLLHNGFAAVGFTGEQYAKDTDKWTDPATYTNFREVCFFILGFLVPYLILNCFESSWTRAEEERA